MSASLTVLILGGYGTFGGRLAELLAPDERLTLVIAGRSKERAQRFCNRLGGRAKHVSLAIDRKDGLGDLGRIRPDVVVDATGPFQAYGDAPYRIVEDCIAHGIDYIDLADGSAFVDGIARFDAAAARRGVFVLAGASSFPVLTAAVVRELGRGIDRVDTVTAGIAPSPYAGVGLNVIRAIASYAGKPVALMRDGKPSKGYPLTETRRFTIAPPGRLPLKNRLFSLVDVPDLRVLPQLWPGLRSVWVGAGPVPEFLHRDLIELAWVVRLKLFPTLAPLARLFHYAINIFRWGEHRGGMFVRVTGSDAKGPLERSWHLLAEGDDGPLIPSMAAAAIVARCLDGRRPESGARSAARDLDLADYARLFAARTIYTGIRETREGDTPTLYRRILGSALDDLPEAIRDLHALDERMTARGRAEIDRGRRLLARLAAAVIGFPKAGRDIPVEVRFDPRDGRETWRRTFAGRSFSSIQEEGTGRSGHLLVERFGPLRFAMALVVDGRTLRLVLRRWTIFGIPLPLWLAPRNNAFEAEEDGRFRFHVEIGHPLTGLIVRYRGWLKPETGPRKKRNAD
jgi:hypothetical protein